MFEGFDIWKLLAGLGIFLFGMFLMEESIKKLSGRTFKRLIRSYTSSKFKSILSGAFVTSILQSSSAISLMTLAFVGAGIMTMENAIGVILGSNLGTTVTAWMVATIGFKINIESFALQLIGTGGLGIIFLGKSEKYSNISTLLVGFGFLFMGLDYMKGSVEVFTQGFDISEIPDYGNIVYLILGILLTAIMQSSSATMAIILTTLNAEIIAFSPAAAMVIGANVGTTITILLGAIGAVQVKKRVAYSHFAFNLFTGILAFIIMPALVYIVVKIVDIEKNAVIGLALFHTIFNFFGVIVFFPFTHLLANLLLRVFPDQITELTQYINNTTTDVVEAAISAIKNETMYMVKKVLYFNLNILNIEDRLVFSGAVKYNKIEKPGSLSHEDKYEHLKLLQAEIFTFAANIQAHKLTETESEVLSQYLLSARMALYSAKTLKDIKLDFDEFENADNLFLNEQYAHFRKKLIATYFKIERVMSENDKKDKTKSILKILKKLKKDDHKFLKLTTQAINNNLIGHINLSTAIIVNRAFVQSSRQILTAIRELLLSGEEIKQYERVEDIADTLSEIE